MQEKDQALEALYESCQAIRLQSLAEANSIDGDIDKRQTRKRSHCLLFAAPLLSPPLLFCSAPFCSSLPFLLWSLLLCSWLSSGRCTSLSVASPSPGLVKLLLNFRHAVRLFCTGLLVQCVPLDVFFGHVVLIAGYKLLLRSEWCSYPHNYTPKDRSVSLSSLLGLCILTKRNACRQIQVTNEHMCGFGLTLLWL